MGIKLEEGNHWGLDFDNFEDGMVWLSMEAYAHPLMLELFVAMLDAYNWWDNAFFAPFAAQRTLIEQARAAGQLQQLAETYEYDITRNLRDEVNIYTYRTPEYMLSSAQDHRPGYGGDQQHVWQATLGPNALCFTTHPAQYGSSFTPDYWTGSGWLPRAAQYKNVAIIIYNSIDQPGLYVPLTLDFTHAWLPKDQFDEVLEHSGWVFARYGDGYLAFRPQNGYVWQPAPGEDQNREMIVPGRQCVYVCELGSRDANGEFADFTASILDASLTFGTLSVEYESPSVGSMSFSWTGDLTVGGEKAGLEDYARYDSAHATAAFPSETVSVEHSGHSLSLDWGDLKREIGYTASSSCDLNDDGSVDAVDVQLAINAALGLPTGVDCDVDGDGRVDAVDVQLTINAALGIS
jgi:hypothetical protein